MNVPTGFLVVRAEGGLPYQGVDRVPPYPSDDPVEQSALEEYVFGEIKDETTNLIASLDSAIRLHRELSACHRPYEVLYCSEGGKEPPALDRAGVTLEPLGYDVAAVRSDYWSIVGDFPPDSWASKFLHKLNEFGLFRIRSDAEAFLTKYRTEQSADFDAPLDVMHIARVGWSTDVTRGNRSAFDA